MIWQYQCYNNLKIQYTAYPPKLKSELRKLNIQNGMNELWSLTYGHFRPHSNFQNVERIWIQKLKNNHNIHYLFTKTTKVTNVRCGKLSNWLLSEGCSSIFNVSSGDRFYLIGNGDFNSYWKLESLSFHFKNLIQNIISNFIISATSFANWSLKSGNWYSFYFLGEYIRMLINYFERDIYGYETFLALQEWK